MTDKQKINLQQEIIDKLEKENASLKNQLLDIETLNQHHNSDNEDDLIDELQKAIMKYNSLIEEVNILKDEYKSHIDEIKDIKDKYLSDLSKLVKNFK